jgi:hypothetical protein
VTNFIDQMEALLREATPGEVRLSKSGYSLRTGWGDDKKIIATAPRAILSSDANAIDVNQWIQNAELWAALHNHADALLEVVKAAQKTVREEALSDDDELCQALRKLATTDPQASPATPQSET